MKPGCIEAAGNKRRHDRQKNRISSCLPHINTGILKGFSLHINCRYFLEFPFGSFLPLDTIVFFVSTLQTVSSRMNRRQESEKVCHEILNSGESCVKKEKESWRNGVQNFLMLLLCILLDWIQFSSSSSFRMICWSIMMRTGFAKVISGETHVTFTFTLR